MTNEGLIFGVSVSGIALVILIIVLVVKHRHKDKYVPGNLGGTDKGCCSLGNQSVCKQNNYYNLEAGCNAKGVTNPSQETSNLGPGGCICNGQGVCYKSGSTGK